MSQEALPCIACGKPLANAFDDVTNQPENGVAFQSEGHYGSAVWDPMDRKYIEVNVCDECLTTHRERVLQGREDRLVTCRGAYVGTTRTRRPLMPWDPDNEDDGVKPLDIDPKDIHAVDRDGEPLYPEIHWAPNAGEWKRSLARSADSRPA